MENLRKKIKQLRNSIDKLDIKLVKLMNKRATYAREIGVNKIKMGAKVRSCAREKEVVRNALHANRGPLSAEAVERLFKLVINISRDTECAAVNRIKKKAK